MKKFLARLACAPFFPGLCFLFLAGCATTPKVDWNARIGSFTFDQAVVELGPPDKSAKLESGIMVAEWLMVRGRSGGVHITGGLGHYYGPGTLWVMDDPPAPDRYLRLTFGPDGKLTAWRRVIK